jgi:hypothetical protein
MKQQICNFISKSGASLRQYSPEILAGVGIIGSITAIVLACKATMKAPAVVEDTKKSLDEVRNKEITPEFTEKDKGKETFKIYLKTGMAFAKLYGPAVTLEILSLGCVLGSNDIYRKRNAQLTSTLIAANEGFKRYRNNVVERFGEEVDYELEHGIRKQEIVREEEDPETGKKKKVKEIIDVADPNKSGCYTKYFTRSNPYWDELAGSRGEPNDLYLENFFSMRETELTTSLSAKRHKLKDPYIILNDAFENYGFEREDYGYEPNWKYDPKKGCTCVDISWRKAYIKNEDNEYEQVYAIDFRPRFASRKEANAA